MRGAHPGDLHGLHVPGRSLVHGLAPEAKLVGLVVFVVAVACTPRHAVSAFVIDALALVVVIGLAGLTPRIVARRLVVVVPFVAFAALLPFIADGEQVEVAGFALSVDGMWAAWNTFAKTVLGASAGIVVAAVTTVPDLLTGLTRLRVPRVLVAIAAFMVRYLDVLVDQLHRMRNAMAARGHDPRWLWQVGPIASSTGALFVRSYERGERIHAAMLARGFTGAMPSLDDRRGAGRDWFVAACPGVVAIAGLATALVTT